MSYFDRYYRLTIGNKDSRIIYETQELNQLRLRFNISHYPGSTMSMASIDIFNIAQHSKNVIMSEYTDITLEAGYRDNFGVIFSGQVINFNELPDGPDTYLRMFCNAGILALDTKRVTPKGLNSNVTVQEVLDLIAKQLGLTIKLDKNQFSALPKKIVGYPVSGTVRSELTRISRDYNLEWYVENKTLVIKKIGLNFKKNPIEVSESTGLIETPILTSSGIRFKTHLSAAYSLNDIINLKARAPKIQFSGAYTIDQKPFIRGGKQVISKIIHNGDTHSDNWFTACECIRFAQ